MLNYLKELKSTPLDAYRLYTAVFLHLGGNFDAVKYRFKAHVSPESFQAHKCRFHFEKAAKTYPTQFELLGYFVWNYLEGNTWITNMTPEAPEKKLAYIESYSYKSKDELKVLRTHEFDYWVTSKHGILPPIFSLCDDGKITLETLCCINNLVDFGRSINVTSDPLRIAEGKITLMTKYQPLLCDLIDHKKLKENILGVYSSS